MIDQTQPTTRGKVMNCKNPDSKFIPTARERVTPSGISPQQNMHKEAIIVPVTDCDFKNAI